MQFVVTTKNGWSYVFEDGELVCARGKGLLELRFGCIGGSITHIYLVTRRRERLLCHVEYDQAGLIALVAVSGKRFSFERGGDGRLLCVRLDAPSNPLIKMSYEDGLIARLETASGEAYQLLWRESPRYRGDFFRRKRRVLVTDGNYEYEFEVNDGIVFLEAQSDRSYRRIGLNLLTGGALLN